MVPQGNSLAQRYQNRTGAAQRFDEAERLCQGRFFPREEGGTNVRQVYLEVKLQRALAAAKSRLASLGFFEEVNFETARTDEVDALDLDVNVVEKSTGALSLGAGYSTADSIVFSASVNGRLSRFRTTSRFRRVLSYALATTSGGEKASLLTPW